MKHLFLVGCVKKKQCCAALAKELYISDMFQKSRKLAEATKCPWFIISAKYGLLHPDKVISPYDKTLNKMLKKERKAWAEKVKEQMLANLPHAEAVVILAAERYYEFLMPYLEERFGTANVKIPMKGLGIGRRLSWLKNADAKLWSCECQDSDERDKE